jgi:phosphatidylserine/phosphatidylglycerophosphate/cardiolipin synthase-like enzyme
VAWFNEFLSSALGDDRLSRGEGRALRELLDDHRPDDDALARMRATLFDRLAEGTGAERREELAFAEEVVRILASWERRVRAQQVEQEALFFPSGRSLQRLQDLLRGVTKTFDICVFTITDDRVSKYIESAVARGVRVRILSDDDKSEDRGSDIDRLRRLGADVKLDDTDDHMHHKFALLDGARLLTGSYNWTRSAADRNLENILVTDDAAMIRAYQEEFDRLWRTLD